MNFLANFKDEVLSSNASKKIIDDFFNLNFELKMKPVDAFDLVHKLVINLDDSDIKLISNTETNSRFNYVYIDFLQNLKGHENHERLGIPQPPLAGPLFSLQINNQNFSWYKNEYHEYDGFKIMYWLLLIEICMWKNDAMYFFEPKSSYMFSGRFTKIKNSLNGINDYLFVYGNGMNKFLGIEWTDDKDIRAITNQGSFHGHQPRLQNTEPSLQELADSIYLYSQIKTYELMGQEFWINVLRTNKTLTYETVILLEEEGAGTKGFNNFSDDLKKYIVTAYEKNGKNKIKNFRINNNEHIYSFFVKSKLIWTTNYDDIYWSDKYISERLRHVHGSIRENNVLFSHFKEKFKGQSFNLELSFFEINKVIIFGWSGDHEPHINIAINGNQSIKEVIVFDKFEKGSYHEYVKFIKYKIMFPNKKVVIIHVDDLNELVEPYTRDIKFVSWEDYDKHGTKDSNENI